MLRLGILTNRSIFRRTPDGGSIIVSLGRIGVRTGITDTIMGMAQGAVTTATTKSKEKQWELMLKMMTTGESKWSLRQWKKIIDAQTSSWAMYIPGMSSSTEVKDLQSFKAILDCFTETELDDSSKINSLTRERVAKSANRSVDDVNKLVQAYKQSDIISTWLNLKKSLGEELPKSEEELMDLQSKDTRLRAIASKVMNPRGMKSGRGRRSPF